MCMAGLMSLSLPLSAHEAQRGGWRMAGFAKNRTPTTRRKKTLVQRANSNRLSRAAAALAQGPLCRPLPVWVTQRRRGPSLNPATRQETGRFAGDAVRGAPVGRKFIGRQTNTTVQEGVQGPSPAPPNPHPLLPLSTTLTHKSPGPYWARNTVYGYHVAPFRRLGIMRGASYSRLHLLTRLTSEGHNRCPWRPRDHQPMGTYIDMYRIRRHCNNLDPDLPWFSRPGPLSSTNTGAPMP